jgi:cytochrome c oxidase subunit II
MINALRGSVVAIAIAAVAVFHGTSALAHPSIDIVASNWKFTPATITLHVGETTTLRLTSSEGIHGLQSDEVGIPMTTIQPGSAKTVEVTAKKPGKYVLHCAVFCGTGHADMTLTVNVVS